MDPTDYALVSNFGPDESDEAFLEKMEHEQLSAKLLATRKLLYTRKEAAVASNGGLAGFWTFPIESVSQSEGGFESVHQSVVVMPHWIVTPDAQGCWQVVMQITAGSLATELATSTGHKLGTGA